MVVCPWCGTNYVSFQSNCSNCGGPLPLPQPPAENEVALPPPPPAPRAISQSYVFRLLEVDGAAIVGLALTILGFVFGTIGFALTLALVTALIGIPFALMGVAFLPVGIILMVWRYKEKEKIVRVLQYGEAVRGEITNVQEDLNIRINHAHPWKIDCTFRLNGNQYEGSVRIIKLPGPQFQPRQPAYILYMPDAPQVNTLYPHP